MDTEETTRLTKMSAHKDEFAQMVSARRVEEFQRMSEDHAERMAELVVVRAQERLQKRKKEYVRRLKVMRSSTFKKETVAESLWRGAATCHGPALDCEGDSVGVFVGVCVGVCVCARVSVCVACVWFVWAVAWFSS